MTDAGEILAQRRAIELSAKVVTILTTKGEDALVTVLAKAQKRATAAYVGLSMVDPEDPKAIRRLQNEIAIYTDLIEHVRQIVIDGAEADEEFSNAREEFADLVISDEDAEALGITKRAPA